MVKIPEGREVHPLEVGVRDEREGATAYPNPLPTPLETPLPTSSANSRETWQTEATVPKLGGS